MGLRYSYPDYEGDFIEENWQEIPVCSHSNPLHGEFRRLCNNMTRQLLDEFEVRCKSEDDFMKNMEWFQLRSSHECLVQAKYLVYEREMSFCSPLFQTKVFIQNMGARLADIKDIPFPENLYIIQEALRGFSFLYQQVGYISISEDLICMNQEGNVKVWLHPDFSSIIPFRFPTNQSTQSGMVNQIIQIIHINTDPDYNVIPIPQFFAQTKQKQLTFKYALQLLQLYAQTYEVKIPTYFETIVEKIREDQGIEYSSRSQTTRENIMSVGNQWIRESTGYMIRSNLFKSQSSKTYADQLKAFDSQVLNNCNSKKSGFSSLLAGRKNCFTDRIIEERKQDSEYRKRSSAHRSQTHHPSLSPEPRSFESDTEMNKNMQQRSLNRKPSVTFTYKEPCACKKGRKKSQLYSEHFQEENSCNLPISPQSHQITFKKKNRQRRKREILECGVQLDPEIVEDLIKYA